MRILWVKPNKLLPIHSGGDIRSYHIARHLTSWHELCFFSYYDGRPDPDYDRDRQYAAVSRVASARSSGAVV